MVKQPPKPPAGSAAWREYVRLISIGDRQIDISARTGIDQGTISRWLKQCDDRPPSLSPSNIRAFAHAYGRPVIEAFVAAGFLTEDEAGLDSLQPADWRETTSTDALVEELRRRANGERPRYLAELDGPHGDASDPES